VKDPDKIIKEIVDTVQKSYVTPKPLERTDKIDLILGHPVIGLVIFFGVMTGVFYLSQISLGPWLASLLEIIMGFIGQGLENGLESLGTGPLFNGFILEGLWGGFTAVLSFLPLIMVLFFLLQLLEDTGYMSRVSMLIDRYFAAIGLGGKSAIPMMVGLACSVPAVMAARTIKDERQRKITVLLTPFVPCGAKLPVIVLLLGVFFSGQAWVTALMYLSAIGVVFLVGWGLKIFFGLKTHPEKTVYDLPNYQWPSLKLGLRMMFAQAKTFIKSAGTIIVVLNGLVWFFVSFNFSLMPVDPDASMLRWIALPFEWMLTPIGITSWGLAVAAILGFVAKEEIVGALAVIYVFSVSDAFDVLNINLARDALMTGASLTALTALSYTVFNLFSPPCFATIGAMKTEFKSTRWLVFAVGLQLLTGFYFAMWVYQIGSLVVYQAWGQGFGVALGLTLGLFIVMVVGYRYHTLHSAKLNGKDFL
jgi:ferrous iron transport protein B